MTVSPNHRSDMLANMFRNFDRLIEADSTSTARSPPGPDSEQHSLINNYAERIKFSFDKDEWKIFLQLLGMDEGKTPAPEDESTAWRIDERDERLASNLWKEFWATALPAAGMRCYWLKLRMAFWVSPGIFPRIFVHRCIYQTQDRGLRETAQRKCGM